MHQYQKFSDSNINNFNHLLSCFDNLCSLSMGLFFPQCLFGRIYELAGFGECFVGCCKIFSIQFITNLLFSSIIFIKELDTLYSNNFINDISNCTKDNICNDYNYTQIYDNNCSLKNINICDCLKNPIVEKCHWEQNLPNTLNNLFYYIFILSVVNITINLNINGIFYGHYRTKLSQKYNILHNSRYDFCIHFIPCIHQLALCQEYNTVYRLELEPVYAVNTF